MKNFLLLTTLVLFIITLFVGLSGVEEMNLAKVVISITSFILGLVAFISYASYSGTKIKHNRGNKIIAIGYTKIDKHNYRNYN